MLLVSDRQITIGGITHAAGEPFEEPDESIAKDLLERRVVRKAQPPKVMYETKPKTYDNKILVPGETPGLEAPTVSPRPPFRERAVSDEEQAPLAPEGDPLLPESGLPESGTPNRGRRRRRKRSDSR